MTISAAAAGSVSRKANSRARFWLCMAAPAWPPRNWRLSMGSSAVPTATPTIPKGNWFTRSA